MKWLVLALSISAFQFPLVGEEVSTASRNEEGRGSRFAALWTGETTYSELELLALAKEADPTVRQFATLRLAELDPYTDAALIALTQALGDPVDLVRLQALAGLARLGRQTTSKLAAALSDLAEISETGTSRSDLAFAALVHAAERDEVDVVALVKAYQSSLPEAMGAGSEPQAASPRERILKVLEQVPAKTSSGVEDLLRAGDPSLQLLAAKRMLLARKEAGAALLLTNVVREAGDASLRQKAAQIMAFVPGGPRALQSLLKDQNPQVRGSAILAYPEHAKESSQLVTALLNDPELEVRRAALGKIGGPEQLEVLCYLGEEPPALWKGFTESVISKILALTRDPDASTREMSVRALGALGCTRPESAPAASEALAAMLSDPVDQVASAAVFPLALLAKRHGLPNSSAALGRVLNRLTHSAGKQERSYLLSVLRYIALPEAHRKELIDILLAVCLLDTENWNCEQVQEILSARSGWSAAAAAALISRSPDAQTFEAWKALEALDLKAHLDTKFLKQLLDHPEKGLQVGAAVTLAQRDHASPRVMQVLEEGVRSYTELKKLGEGEASRALADLGEQGIKRIIAIMEDPTTGKTVRMALIAQTLLRKATKSSRASAALLAAASDPTDPEIQQKAVEALFRLQLKSQQVRAALEKAFLNGTGEVRLATVGIWRAAGQWQGEMPEDLATRVFADPEPKVRAAGVALLALLSDDDPKRLSLMASALRDTDENVRNRALLLAGELGGPGAALLAEYVERGEPLTFYFASGLKRLESFEGSLGSALRARLPSESPGVRNQLIDLLSRSGISLDREFLYDQLESASEVDRGYAARALAELGEDPWARDGLLAAVLMDSEVRKIMEWRLRMADDRLEPHRRSAQASASLLPSPSRAPKFPWPPPPGYSRLLVPHELFAVQEREASLPIRSGNVPAGTARSSTLGDVHKKLVRALEKASGGFDHGLFQGPADGITLVARMERIDRDGTPLPEPARWIKEGSPKLKLSELLADLFFEKPGYFRIIVFAVTDDLVPGEAPAARLPEPEKGAAGIPRDFAERPFEGKEVLALVYSFERRHNAKITPWKDGAPSARQHLERAGVWPGLAPAAPRR
jgi:hypothetical protein